MPLSETSIMEERARFVLEALEGWTPMSELCARYDVSRRVGCKWLARYREAGLPCRSVGRRWAGFPSLPSVVAARHPAGAHAAASSEDNGAHERMHRTLKAEATRPARETAEQQQRAFERFRAVYNEERPHEALGNLPPAALYRPSERRLPRRLPALVYPEGFDLRRVSRQGQIRWRRRLFFVSETLHRQVVGLKSAGGGLWDLYFGPALLAVLDEGEGVLRPADRWLKPRPGHR